MPEKKENTSTEDLPLLVGKIDMLVRLQALSLVSRFESQKEKILFLRKVGMPMKDIAELLGTSVNTVNVTLVKARKSATKGDAPKLENDDAETV